MEQRDTMHLLPENMVNLSAANIQTLALPALIRNNMVLDVLRLDKIDPVISGNKWFKLQYYLEAALQNRQQAVLTFGGAWSNHIIATAAAAKKAGLKSIGLIRGEQPAVLSGTLLKAIDLAMQVIFLSRKTYNQKKDPAFKEQLLQQFDYPCIIPEGGAGARGIQGAAEILQLTRIEKYTHVICAVGTGTLLSGLVKGSLPHQQIIGIPVLKGYNDWRPVGITKEEEQRIHILPDYHMGGYAKKNGKLLDFMNSFYQQTGIPLDFVYTGKLFFAVMDLIKKNYFPAAGRLLVIHSGGLQGNDSLPAGTLVF